jgi:hypothetical protein
VHKFRVQAQALLIVIGVLYNEGALAAATSTKLPVVCKGLASLGMLIELPQQLETREFIESSYPKWGRLFSEDVPFAAEVEGILANTKYVKSLPQDRDGNEFYLFEGQDRLQRRWHVVLKVKKGQYMDDGELISMNPSSFNPYDKRSNPTKVSRTYQPPSPEEATPEALLRVTSKIQDLVRLKKIRYTGHIFSYMSNRFFSQSELDSMIMDGKVYAVDGVGRRGDTVYKMTAKDSTNHYYRIIIGVGPELTVISVASRSR